MTVRASVQAIDTPMAPDGIQGHVASNPRPVVTAHLPDPKVIQQAVNTAQRGTTINPPQVIALPPARNAAQKQTGPDVHVPSSWRNFQDSRPPVHSEPPRNVAAVPCGYTPNHALYGSEHISALYEGGSRRSRLRGTPFSSICEGKKDIDAHITAPELVSIALTTIVPKIHAFCPGFRWKYDEFIVRDTSWVNLLDHPDRNRPYFYGECVQPGTRKNAKSLVFKSKQFSLYVVVPAVQWKDYENFIETVSMDYATKPHQPVVNLPSTRARLVDSFSSVAERPISHDVRIAEAKSQSQASSGNQLFVDSEKRDNPSPSPTTTNQCTPSKHNYQASISVSSVITISPPRKKVVHPPVPSPDHNKVIEALACGGAADVDVKKVLKMKLESVVFYPIPTLPLEDILENSNKHSFQINPCTSHPGQLIFNTSTESLLGVGAFKMAYAAQLILTPPAPTGLGSLPRHDVVMKRPYHSTGDGNLKDKSTIQIGRYVLQQELEKLFWEANVLYWSQSLMMS
ncbi:hypothetical protein M404DRAFT_20945 [Pisolithus tinctorius Marx 270]|uniref:Uncharacterized protein n=1 Tax=Pisolithus tinctorius Marx 270 TaxID=870435 RepID=A0A0C3JNB9_PISTI|nr:hypothetical protein M404DRAFT_20945 [Pisolithus tinctorius Marx 270]